MCKGMYAAIIFTFCDRTFQTIVTWTWRGGGGCETLC